MTTGRPSADLPHVIGGSPTDDELAAVAAVFASLLIERAASNRRVPPARRTSAWDRQRRVLRTPWPRDARWTDRDT